MLFLMLKLAKVMDMFWFFGVMVKIFSVHTFDIVGGVSSNSKSPTRLQSHILLNTYNHSFLYKRKKDHLEKGLSLSLNPNLFTCPTLLLSFTKPCSLMLSH